MPTKILIIDDDADMIDLLKIVLQPNAFELTTAYNGQDGIELIRQFKPDIIILDLLLPGIDGLSVCREVRSFSNIPILVLSAVNRPGIVAQALDVGADDYLHKPMKSSILIASLNKLARRMRAEQQSNHMNNTFPV